MSATLVDPKGRIHHRPDERGEGTEWKEEKEDGEEKM